jgi:2-keto-4-pentenoate hydratase/2-oxohepta-3-ene-1,7-dioic acid hydratase in catechol pathway
MRLARYSGGRIGAVVGHHVVELSGPDTDWPPVSSLKFIADFEVNRAGYEAKIAGGGGVPLADVTLETPVPWPNKVIAFPANYHAHIEEMKGGLISTFKASGQGFFLKANSSLSGPAAPIVLPAVADREIHHESELAIIIGKGGRDISRADALGHIFGYACLIDVVIRGREERVMRKSFDSFCPVGPWITTADEITDPTDIDVKLWVNGELRQSANTRALIVDIPEMIAMASSVMTLYPGDIIASGTPAGVAPIRDGDMLRIAIGGVGEMTLPIVQGMTGAHSVWDKTGA